MFLSVKQFRVGVSDFRNQLTLRVVSEVFYESIINKTLHGFVVHAVDNLLSVSIDEIGAVGHSPLWLML